MLMRLFRSLATGCLRSIDGCIPDVAKATNPDALRSRLLVASSFGLAFFALFFLIVVYAIQGLSPTAWAFLIGCPLLLVNPFVLRVTHSNRIAGTVFCLELIFHLAFMAYYNGGYDSASLVWNPAILLLAAFFVGPVFSLGCALLLVGETVGLYLLDQAGYPFPQPLSEEWMR